MNIIKRELTLVSGHKGIETTSGLTHRILRKDKGGSVYYILAERPMTHNPADHYLSVVLALYNGTYVTWVYNTSGDEPGYHNGHYFGSTRFDFRDAFEDFMNRD